MTIQRITPALHDAVASAFAAARISQERATAEYFRQRYEAEDGNMLLSVATSSGAFTLLCLDYFTRHHVGKVGRHVTAEARVGLRYWMGIE